MQPSVCAYNGIHNGSLLQAMPFDDQPGDPARPGIPVQTILNYHTIPDPEIKGSVGSACPGIPYMDCTNGILYHGQPDGTLRAADGSTPI